MTPVTSAVPTAAANSDARGSDTASAEATSAEPSRKTSEFLAFYRITAPSKVRLPFAPLTAKQKLRIATKDTIDGPSYVLAGAFAGLYQLENQNPSFGQGFKGYARRYASAIARSGYWELYDGRLHSGIAARRSLGYFRRGYGKFWSRVFYAARGVVVSRTDANKPTFNFSEFLGNGITASVGNAYYPDEVGFTPTMARMFTQIGTDSFSSMSSRSSGPISSARF